MLVRIALDCEALQGNGADSVANYYLHKELLRLLDRHGVLIVPEDKHILEMRKILKDPGLRELWATWWTTLRKHRGRPSVPTCLCKITDVDNFITGWGGRVDVALLSVERAKQLGVPEGRAAREDMVSGAELARFELLYAAERLSRVRELSEKHLSRHERTDTIWRERFSPLAEYSQYITICDRYAGKNLCERYTTAGVGWFLRKLSLQSSSYVHFITGSKEGAEAMAPQIEEMVRRLIGELPGNGIEDFQLTIAPDKAFSSASHDRHLRFDRVSIWIGRGLEIFESEEQKQDTSCQYVSKDVTESKERGLIRRARINNEDLRKRGERIWAVEEHILRAS